MSMTSLSSLSSDEEISRRRFPDRIDLWNKYDDEEFLSKFRLSKETVEILLSKIGHLFDRKTKRNKAFDARTQLLVALRFYATGTLNEILKDLPTCDKASICRMVQKVTDVIANMAPDYIKMPTQKECDNISEEFHNIAGFPNVIGTIDCTKIKIKSPGGNLAENFKCREGFYTINVQIVADSKFRIANIFARCPGSVQESTIFNNSPLSAILEHGDHYPNYCLLGNSAYQCKKYLITPILNPQSIAEQNYNESHSATMHTMEECIGLWRGRFTCAQKGITLRKMDTILKVIIATAVLHNFAIEQEEQEIISDLEVDTHRLYFVQEKEDCDEDCSVRTSLVDTVFANWQKSVKTEPI